MRLGSRAGVKTHMDGPGFVTVNNYCGSLLYMNSFFLSKDFPAWQINQTGSREFNLTLIGNAFNSMNPDYLAFKLASGAKSGKEQYLANAQANFSDLSLGQTWAPLPDQNPDKSLWLLRLALDDCECDISFL